MSFQQPLFFPNIRSTALRQIHEDLYNNIKNEKQVKKQGVVEQFRARRKIVGLFWNHKTKEGF